MPIYVVVQPACFIFPLVSAEKIENQTGLKHFEPNKNIPSLVGGTSKDIEMKIFPWEWGHWLIFSTSFVQCPRFSRVEGGGVGIYFDWCIMPENISALQFP